MKRLLWQLFVVLVICAIGCATRALAQDCPCTVWSASATPVNPDSGDATRGEYGVKFRSDVNGQVTGIRFYKSAANTGTHTGNLWSSNGTLLASATFVGESATGWQQVGFSSPVSVTAGTTYVASYFAPAGHYSDDINVFAAAGVDNPPLHALANGIDGGNAVFAYGTTSAFPTSTYGSSNYWVDVVFTTTVPFGGPAVSSFSPSNGLSGVSTNTNITVTFTRNVDPSTVNNGTIQVTDPLNNVVSGSVTYNSSSSTAVFQPSSPLLQASNYTVVVRGGTTDPRIKDLSGNPMAASVTWSFATANPPGVCPCTVWTPASVPATVDSGDPNGVELGVRFRSDTSGFITGIRYYKSAANTGTHIGNLWTNTGTLLATATFSVGSGTGWQQVMFPSAVAISAGTTYVASYFAPAGHYAFNSQVFASQGVDNSPLHLLQNGADGSNGVFTYGSNSSFPASTYGSSNYWVDVVFNTTSSSGTPPVVTSFSPANGASNISTNTAISATFNKAVNSTTVNGSTFQLVDASGKLVSATVSYNNSTFTATLQPTAALAPSSTYTAIVPGGGVKDSSGNALAANVMWSFATASTSQAPVVASFLPANAASSVSVSTAVTVTLNKAIDPTTITGSTFQLRDSAGNAVTATLTYNPSSFTAALQPAAPLNYSTTYTAVVVGGATDPRVKDTLGNPLPSNVSWVFTTAAPPPPPPGNCPCSIWPVNAIPANPDSNEAASVEVGVKFRSSSNGLIVGIRFYKGADNTGTHIGNLWTSTGTLLASAVFTNETSSGWQQVYFSNPVPIVAGTTYIASYFAPKGYYAFDQTFFTATVNSPPLSALGNGVDGPNGVFTYASASTFPSSSYNASNYWVDMIYVINQSTNAPSRVSVSPTSGSTAVNIGSAVSVSFNEPMDGTTFSSATCQLVDSQNNAVPGSVTFDAPSATVTFTPTGSFVPQTTYTARLKGTVKDMFGNMMGSDFTWSFTTGSAPANTGPGGPMLVISSSSNPFTRYLGEILQAEGMNEFTVQDMSTVSSSTLSSYDLVVLGDMQLTATQAAMLNSWVNGGGRLIAMHPDEQLAGLLGLTNASSTLSNAYLAINTAVGPGVGIVAQPIQFHGTADLYTLSGAQTFATLYSNATNATIYPAVSWVNVGNGQAAAFTYDLARSVVYTRQGNPAWSGQQRDPYIDPAIGFNQIRSDDLFYGNAPFDPEPNWVNLNNVTIPQADEQQRLLVNLIEQMNVNRKPLPRFWYFPSGFKAVVIMTGDDHNVGGTSGRFDQYLADSAPGCSVPDWTCVRSTSYVWPDTPIPNYQTYISEGFEIANHTDNHPSCTNFTPESLEASLKAQWAELALTFPNLPASKTNRTHCVLWSDYDSEPQVLLNHGIRFDTSYYYWPPPWVNNQSGMFTGSGMPMRYTDRNGNIFDVYQATTQMPDEDPWNYDQAISTLLDNALGPLSYYGAFTMNMHTDQVQSAGSDAIVTAAQARNVPIVSSLQMLTWLDGRNTSSFGSLAWNGSTLTFTISVGSGARNLQAMLPVNSSGGTLKTVRLNGSAVGITTQTIKGVQYAIFTANAGSYQALYGAGGAWSISGTLSGPGAASASVSVTGSASATVTADPNGHYLITGLPNGSYTVTPSQPAYTFTPASSSVTISGANINGVNFGSFLTPTFTLSGTISGAGGSFATVTLKGFVNGTTVADSSGNFIFSGVVSGSYTVTPAKSACVFTPSARNVTVNNANITDVAFSSSAATSSVIAADVTISKDNSSASSTIATPAFSTALGNELLLAFISADYPGSGSNTTATGVTGAGLTWTLVRRTNQEFGTAEVWRAMAPAPLNNVAVTAAFSLTAPESSITVVVFSGVDISGTNGSGAIGATASGAAPSGAPSASIVTTRTNSWVYGVGVDWDNAISRAPDANQTVVHQFLTTDSDTFWVQRQNSPIPTPGTTVSIDDIAPTTDQYNLTVVEILPVQ